MSMNCARRVPAEAGGDAIEPTAAATAEVGR